MPSNLRSKQLWRTIRKHRLARPPPGPFRASNGCLIGDSRLTPPVPCSNWRRRRQQARLTGYPPAYSGSKVQRSNPNLSAGKDSVSWTSTRLLVLYLTSPRRQSTPTTPTSSPSSSLRPLLPLPREPTFFTNSIDFTLLVELSIPSPLRPQIPIQASLLSCVSTRRAAAHNTRIRLHFHFHFHLNGIYDNIKRNNRNGDNS